MKRLYEIKYRIIQCDDEFNVEYAYKQERIRLRAKSPDAATLLFYKLHRDIYHGKETYLYSLISVKEVK